MVTETATNWLTVEVSTAALRHNIGVFRELVPRTTRLLAVVKAEAYGHGLLVAAEAFLAGGADLLGVHSLSEAARLRGGGIDAAIMILGPVDCSEAARAAELGCEVTVGSLAGLAELAASGARLPVHLKVETGVNRQGVTEDELPAALQVFTDNTALKPVGLSSHFADIEDTTDHAFAETQMKRFGAYSDSLAAGGYPDLAKHMSCSAATLLWDRSHGDIARVGISAYGIWPSRETWVSVRQRGRQEVRLMPAVTWKCRISQVRRVPAGQTVGYGRTWKAMTDSRVAILPVGYSDGWLRAFARGGHVLVGGCRAPLVGRICMNLCMADVTNVPTAAAGNEAVLLGTQGGETITAEMLADQLGTIAYEILTLPGPTWRRVAV